MEVEQDRFNGPCVAILIERLNGISNVTGKGGGGGEVLLGTTG